MDQIKIGRFVAETRRAKGFTQRQLADQLSISDKTISKWETGKGLPDVSLMLPLCQALDITVNDLLTGARVSASDYQQKAEENMMDLIKENQENKKRFALSMVCAAITVIAVVALVFLASYLDLPVPARIAVLALAVLAVVFLALMVYTLFFALPFSATYLEENAPRKAYTGGMYALCRHPGVLWFAGAYLCLGLLLGTPKAAVFALVMTGLNIAYVLFQDRWTFPQSFVNYEEYRRTTPFLLPTPGSAVRCVRTWKGGAEQ
jgi:protein-S-isoprenylcysteine O-methyltransferase Ste14/DNA-binding XRE family transcriptional regulator